MNRTDSLKGTLNSGYLLIPRMLLNRMITRNDREMSEEMAFLSMLSLVNFKNVKDSRGECGRGESDLQIAEWAAVFRWPEWKTRRFFTRLEKSGEISIRKDKYRRTIRITRYEELCANKKEKPGKPPENQNDALFEEFWQTYHQITRQTPQEREATRREWNRLPAKEREPAIDGIGEYFMSLKSVEHVRKAVNYLRLKSYK